MAKGEDFKQTSAKVLVDILADPRVRKGLNYLRGEEFQAERDRIKQEASKRLQKIRKRYRPKKRNPETAAQERDLSLRLAEVEAEAAEMRVRLSELLEEEERLRKALEDL